MVDALSSQGRVEGLRWLDGFRALVGGMLAMASFC